MGGEGGSSISCDSFAEFLVALAFVLAERGELLGAVARGHAHEEAAAGKPVDGSGALGHEQRVLEWHDDGGGAERDRRGVRGYVAQVHPGVVDLADIAERLDAQRDVAHPDGGHSPSLGLADEAQLVVQAVERVLLCVFLDGQGESEGELARPEGALEAGELPVRRVGNLEERVHSAIHPTRAAPMTTAHGGTFHEVSAA